MLIDSHAHLDSYSEEDRTEVLTRAQAAGVETILSIGIGEGPDFMHQALDIARASTSPRVYASAGIHPEQAHNANPEALSKLTALAADPLCIAIGEIGLDYYHLDNPDIPTQQAAFIAQMAVAAAARKPILIHLRTSELATPQAQQKYAGHDATADFFRLIEEHWTPTGLPGVMHCFSGTPEDAVRAVALGFYLSFAGNLTYPRSVAIREAAAIAPADRILVETDCPFLAPIPHRGQRNEPALVVHTAAALAELRGISSEELAGLTTQNFHRLFPTTA
jgi:TatD DNase family protein